MELLKEKLAQLLLEAEEARKEADKEIWEKEEAMSRVEEVSQVYTCHNLYLYSWVLISQLENEVGELRHRNQLLEADLERAEETSDYKTKEIESAYESVDNLQR